MSARGPKRRRPGRLRRWVLRPVAWSLALVVALFAAVVLYLESAAFADLARRVAERRLAEALGREVTIGAVDLDLMPFSVTVENVSIVGPTPDAEPLFSLARGSVEAEPAGLFGRGLALDHVYLVEPRLEIGFDEDGRVDLPRLGGGAGGRPVELRFGTVEIEGGELILDDDRTPIDLTARRLEAVFTGVDKGVELRGRALAPDLGLVLPPGRSFEGRVEIHAMIRSHRLDLVRAEVTGPDLEARADGFWRWHGDRELALTLAASGDLGVLGDLGYLEGQATGPFALSGRLTRQPAAWAIEVDVTSPRAVVFDRVLTDLEATVNADADALAIEIRRAGHGGGTVTGGVELGLAAEPGSVEIALDLDRVALGRLTADLGIPVQGLSGGVSGPFDYRFDGALPAKGNGRADLRVVNETLSAPSDLPVTGAIPLTIEGGVVRSEALRIIAPSFRLTGEGDFDLATAAGLWRFEIDADEVAEVLSLVPAAAAIADNPPDAWRPMAGSGRAEGELRLGSAGADLWLDLDLAAVEAPGLRADRVTGRVALDGAGLRELGLEATRRGAALRVTGAVPFDDPATGTAVFPFALEIDATAWPLEEARAWLPFELDATGPYTGTVELAPAPLSAGLAGRLAGRVAPVGWGELCADSLDLDARFDPAELSIERADLEVAGGTVGVTGAIGWEELALDLSVESTPLEPARLLDLPATAAEGLAALAGRLSGRVGGRLETPDVTARLEWSDPAADPVDLVWRDGRVTAAGDVPGIMRVEGGGTLSPEEVRLDLALVAGRLEGLSRLAAPDLGLEGEFSGHLRVDGSYEPPASPASPTSPTLPTLATVSLDRLTVRLPDEPGATALPSLSNLEPVVLRVGDAGNGDGDGAGVRLRSLYLGDEAGTSEVFLGGRVGPGGELDLQLQTTIGSDWLAAAIDRLWPGARWRGGTVDAIATVEGDLATPRVNGVGEVRGGGLVTADLPFAIEDLSGTVLFYRDQAVVDSVVARVGGGNVRAGGVVPLGGRDAPAFRFQAVGERLSYRSPEGWTARGGGELVLAATPDGQQLSGGLVLDEVLYVKDVKLGLEQLFSGLFGSERLEVVPAEGWQAATDLDLRLEGDRALRVRNNVADLRGSADLVLRGTLARPVVFGSIELEPGGRLEYGGAGYRIERGQLAFTNPYRIEPAIDLSASAELREYDVTLAVAGTPDRLELDLASNPPLADLDVLGLLAGAGGDGDQPAGGDAGAEGFLYGEATSLIAQRFNRLFGLDKFRIDPLTSATGSVSSARVTAGKRLTRNLLVTYSYDPSSTEEQILELSWSVTRHLVLVMTQNGDGTYAVDALWERAF